ncbi:MAG: FHA domain-containing protein [Marinilabiliaceae bacterium]|nr:FHA domain-containing protein [Marinilabiliaceae bacterium]
MMMIKCLLCSEIYQEEITKCTKCGGTGDLLQPYQEPPLRKTTRGCPRCGEPLKPDSSVCPKCENQNNQNKTSDNKNDKETAKKVLLRIIKGEEPDKIYKLNDLIYQNNRVITVGRKDISANNILTLKEDLTAFISRKQCTIELRTDNKWYIRDGQQINKKNKQWEKSKNGTFINEVEVSTDGTQIKIGDTIIVGEILLKVEEYL